MQRYFYQTLTLMLVWASVFSTSVLKAQVIAPTTEEEYNYGSIGYRIQLQTRMSDKPGYTLKDAEGCEDPERKLEYKLMFRTGETVPCAVIMIYSRPRSSPAYFCIPSANAAPTLWEKFRSSLTSGTDIPSAQLQFFSNCLARFCMENMINHKP